MDLGPGLDEITAIYEKLQARCSSGYTHPQIHNHHHPDLSYSSRAFIPNLCSKFHAHPPWGPYTINYPLCPIFLSPSSSHLNTKGLLYNHYLLQSNKRFCLWTRNSLNSKILSTLAVFLSSLSQSSITQSFPIQTAPALPNTVYAKVASGTKCSGLLLWNSQVAPNITNHFPLLKLLCPLFIGPCPPLIPTCGSSTSSTFYPRLSSLFLRQSHILWRFACVALCQLLTDLPPTLTSSFPNEFPYQAVYLTSLFTPT